MSQQSDPIVDTSSDPFSHSTDPTPLQRRSSRIQHYFTRPANRDLPSSERNPVVSQSTVFTSSIEAKKRLPPPKESKPKESILKKAKANEVSKWPPVYSIQGPKVPAENLRPAPPNPPSSTSLFASSQTTNDAEEFSSSASSVICRPLHGQKKLIIESSSADMSSSQPLQHHPASINTLDPQIKNPLQASHLMQSSSLSSPIPFPLTQVPLSSSGELSRDPTDKYEVFEEENTLQPIDEDTVTKILNDAAITEIFAGINDIDIASQTKDVENVEGIEDAVVAKLAAGLFYQADRYIHRLLILYSRYKKVRILTYDIYMKDLIDLYDGNWLGEAIVECYIHRLRAVEQQRFHILSGAVCNEWRVMKPQKVQAMTFPYILVPLCYNGHWIVAVLKMEDKLIQIYDSNRIGGEEDYYKINYLHRIWRGLYVTYEVEAENWKVQSMEIEQQKDGSSCGVFAMICMKRLVMNCAIRPFGNPGQERIKAIWEIMFGLLE